MFPGLASNFGAYRKHEEVFPIIKKVPKYILEKRSHIGTLASSEHIPL